MQVVLCNLADISMNKPILIPYYIFLGIDIEIWLAQDLKIQY